MTTTTTTTTATADPFASVQVPGAQAAKSASLADPFTSATDTDDPFATSSDFRGSFVPSPTLEVLQGRLVVMIPRELDKNARDYNDPSKTREVYHADLTVLDGGELSYTYKQKGDPEKGTTDEWRTWEAGNVTPENPFTIEGFWVPQGAIIGKLKQAHAKGAPYLGVVGMIPTKTQREKGATTAQVRAEYDQWIKMGRPGARPKYSWVLEDPTPEQRQAAIAWWGRVRSNIRPIVPMQY